MFRNRNKKYDYFDLAEMWEDTEVPDCLYFNCFIRADIDNVEAIKLSIKVALGKIDEICRMLEEKRDATETIANSEGIENLYEAMRSSNEQGGYKYNEEIIKSVKMVLENYPKLEKIHEEGSIHSEEERKY